MRRTRKLHLAAVLLTSALAFSCREEPGGPDLGGLPFGEDAAFKNPLLDVEVGEWAIYRRMDGQELRWEVVSLHPRTREAIVRETARDPKVDKLIDDHQVQFAANHMLAGFVSARQILLQVYFDEIDVAGRTWLALCVDAAGNTTGRVRQWYSNEVPVTGLLRQEKVEPNNVRIMTELVDWSGRTEEQGR
jgi:hypothetical protein